MSLLELERVGKSYHHGARQIEVLRDISLELDEGEVIAIWGPARSGRSTLLRIAAGIDAPDLGLVRFRGRGLALSYGGVAHGVAYCGPRPRSLDSQIVLDELIAAQLARGIRRSKARARAWSALERTDARRCEGHSPYELDRNEEVRVAIARALLQDPSLLVIDEPIKGVDALERDNILELLRSLAQDRIAVLMSLDKGVGLFAADRALSLGEGQLRGHVAPELAPVVELPQRASG
jgi:putative ABC transport system ATP-binding protein